VQTKGIEFLMAFYDNMEGLDEERAKIKALPQVVIQDESHYEYGFHHADHVHGTHGLYAGPTIRQPRRRETELRDLGSSLNETA
jgi:hypothetical protein